MKKILLSFLLFFSFQASVFWDEACDLRDGYERYLCNVKNTCEIYEPEVRIFNTEKTDKMYLEDYNLSIAKGLYRQNMNDLYRCAILKSQNNAYRIVGQKLKTPFSWNLDDIISGQRDRLTEQIDRIQCQKAEIDNFEFKVHVLKESTFEMCKYMHFLEYLRTDHVNNFNNLLKEKEISENVEALLESNPEEWRELYLEQWRDPEYKLQQKNYTIWEIIELDKETRDEMAEEIQHTKRVYEVAFQTYSNYENNLVVHILLEMLENDFLQLRNKLYSALSPINQVVYKVINAMSQ